MTDTGRIDEDVYSLRETKKYIGDIYNKRIHEKGGVHESDGYADALGDVIKHLDRAVGERESERSPTASVAGQAMHSDWLQTKDIRDALRTRAKEIDGQHVFPQKERDSECQSVDATADTGWSTIGIKKNHVYYLDESFAGSGEWTGDWWHSVDMTVDAHATLYVCEADTSNASVETPGYNSTQVDKT